MTCSRAGHLVRFRRRRISDRFVRRHPCQRHAHHQQGPLLHPAASHRHGRLRRRGLRLGQDGVETFPPRLAHEHSLAPLFRAVFSVPPLVVDMYDVTCVARLYSQPEKPAVGICSRADGPRRACITAEHRGSEDYWVDREEWRAREARARWERGKGGASGPVRARDRDVVRSRLVALSGETAVLVADHREPVRGVRETRISGSHATMAERLDALVDAAPAGRDEAAVIDVLASYNVVDTVTVRVDLGVAVRADPRAFVVAVDESVA